MSRHVNTMNVAFILIKRSILLDLLSHTEKIVYLQLLTTFINKNDCLSINDVIQDAMTLYTFFCSKFELVFKNARRIIQIIFFVVYVPVVRNLKFTISIE